MSIADDIAALDADALIELFELDATAIDGPHLYFHAGTNELREKVTWQGQAYEAWPVEVQGFAWRSGGTLPRPKITITNIAGLITQYLLEYQDLLGARLIRHRTLKKYLDAVNFPGGVNESADPDQYLPDEIWYIFQKSGENKQQVEFTLAAAIDVQGTLIPRRQIIQNHCNWVYKSAECSWVPSAGHYYDKDDNPVTDPSKDVCGKHVSSCKVRFGQSARLPYGGFPAAGLINQ